MAGRGDWPISRNNGHALPARVTREDGWLSLVTTHSLAHIDDVSLLVLNRHLPGTVRAARPLRASFAQLRADLHLGTPDLDERIAKAYDEIAAASQQLATGATPLPMEASADDEIVEQVRHLCEEAGWPQRPSDDGGVRLDLETRAGTFTATLCGSRDALPHFFVELTSLSDQSEVSRRATARLLMALSATVRTVKPQTIDRGGLVAGVSSALERVDADAINRTASALAVACQLAGREVQALRDERLAGAYLALEIERRDVNPDPTHTREEEPCLQQL
jgi:hypothetical protein